MPEVKKRNRTKYKLFCTAPEHLTEFNDDRNKKVTEQCIQEDKFEPHISCTQAGVDGGHCEYLKVKKIG